jgi:hypothetical protein
MLGVLTYDANMLIIEPGSRARDAAPARTRKKPGKRRA